MCTQRASYRLIDWPSGTSPWNGRPSPAIWLQSRNPIARANYQQHRLCCKVVMAQAPATCSNRQRFDPVLPRRAATCCRGQACTPMPPISSSVRACHLARSARSAGSDSPCVAESQLERFDLFCEWFHQFADSTQSIVRPQGLSQ